MGTSAAAWSVAGACPPANAATEHAPTTARHEHKHARPRHHRALPKPTLRNGSYVYTLGIGNTVATEGKPNAACSGASMRITRLATYPESQNATALWERTPDWGGRTRRGGEGGVRIGEIRCIDATESRTAKRGPSDAPQGRARGRGARGARRAADRHAGRL